MREKPGGKSTERSAACKSCGKTFARSDTLLRHEKNHHSTEDRGPVHRVTTGTFRACHACATARSRCSGGLPCGRCNLRQLECIYPNKRRKTSLSTDTAKTKDDEATKQQILGNFNELVFAADGRDQLSSNPRMSVDTLSTSPAFPSSSHNVQASVSSNYELADHSVSQDGQPSSSLGAINPGTAQMLQNDHFGNDYLAPQFSTGFVEPTAAFEYSTFDEPLNWIPPSIYPSPYDAELEQDFSFILPTLPSNLDADYAVDFSINPPGHIYSASEDVTHEPSETHGIRAPFVAVEQSPASSTSDGIHMPKSVHGSSTSSDLKRKKRKNSLLLDIFTQPRKRSTGYAFPDAEDSWTSMLTNSTTEYCPGATYELISSRFRNLCVETTSPTPFRGFDFPPFEVVNTCIDLYFENFHKNFPLLHQASFGPQSDWIVVLAVATIGSSFAKSSYGPEVREAFQEFLRRAVDSYADGEPDAGLDLPLAQARILNLVGLVQSEREQLRALSHRYHADLSRWCLESGVLQLSTKGDLLGGEGNGDGVEDLLQFWPKWIRIESLRRVGYMAWLLDCCLGYMANARPLCNMDDARTPLPCSESAWNASSPEVWADRIQELAETPSLCGALETLYSKKQVDPEYSELSQTLLMHALYQRTWEVGTHIKQPLSEWVPTGKARGFLNTPSKDNFWLPLYPLYANWRNSACDCLDVLHWQASSIVAKASGLEHGVILHLHLARIVLLTPFQEIQDLLFSLIGKVGHSPKASFYVHDGSYQPRNSVKLPQIRKITWRWLREDQHKARLAMVHAGSVFCLVLWTYGSYKSAAFERDAAAASQKPEGGPSGPDAGAPIQPSRMERKERPIKFISKANGQPGKAAGPSIPPHSASPGSHVDLRSSDNKSVSVVLEGTTAGSRSPPAPSSDSDTEEDTSSSDEQPEFIHLDRPCDDEMVQHFVRNGHTMSGHMTNVGDICKAPQKVVLEGAKLLRTRLACWGVSREYYDILMKLAELRKAS
ncbi:Fungal Zn2-Cys6 binuclear cluster domain-containing protein [Cladophialophora immunda]|nr:Fungal Zn2-Cys6 binuclear cluster domain-containing protein [Cladophialophora immunda]